MEFYDVLSLEEKQVHEVRAIASQYIRIQLQEYKDKGFDIPYLTANQRHRVVRSKNRIVFGRNPATLKREQKIVISLHSQVRVFEREGSKELKTILNIIQRIIDADKVSKAQFKGYSSLTYTLTKDGDPTSYKLPIRFKWVKGKRQILSVTVSFRDAPPSKMTTKIANSEELESRMAAYRKKLVDRSQKK
ncbi:hypothetical protein [Lentibacillus cibarius]|uniref:Uncharacterized protein n=1 Tax=Lentibacillus cibarius TaxID=2583219 RepID=A0A5S3QIH4_9BACI|nr:hypothetical protein [Lentibacillus cibarius]TMN21730.1 hypothetical protein FFL34_06075 [Lentibacillus cibarius]